MALGAVTSEPQLNVLSRRCEVVRSSRGRLRVHLPHWSGQGGREIVARLRQLRGVTDAQANGLTGNVLVLFDARQTTSDTLLAELVALPVELAVPPSPVRAHVRTGPSFPDAPPSHVIVANGERLDLCAVDTVHYVTGPRRVLYRVLGWASVGMAVVGILPGIPTAPFVVLAGYFFIRSSPAAHAWLLQSRYFGPMLRDWEQYHGITRSMKYTAIGLIAAGAVFSTLIGLPATVLATIYALQIVGLIIVLRLRVVDRSLPALTAV